jgi:hypothetical protein
MRKIGEIGLIYAYTLATSLSHLCGDEAGVIILISFFHIKLCDEHILIFQIAKLL